MSIGGAEILIIIGVVVVLFGPALVAFWIGYVLGSRRPSPPTAPLPRPMPEPPAPAETPTPSAEEHSADE